MQDSLTQVLQHTVSKCVNSKCRHWSLVSVEGEQKHLRGSYTCAVVAGLAVHLFPSVPSKSILRFQAPAPGNIITQAQSYISVDGNRMWPLGPRGFGTRWFSLTSVTGLGGLPVLLTTTACFRRGEKELEMEILNYLQFSVVVSSFLVVYPVHLSYLGICNPLLHTHSHSDSKC